MIQSFKCKETEKIWQGLFSKKFPNEIQGRALRKLRLIDAAGNLEDLKIPPSNRFKPMTKDRKGQYAVRINKQWRICFVWKDGHAEDVEIIDYH